MAGPADQYADEMHGALHYYAAWDPGTPLSLGTIGTLMGRRFVPKDHLKNLGIPFKTLKDTAPVSFAHATHGAVDVALKAQGKTSAAFASISRADAGLKLTFKGDNVVWFAADECLTDRIADQIQLGDEIKRRYTATPAKWEKDWLVITHLVRASATTVLISQSQGANAELKLRGNVGAAGQDIARASAHATLAGSQQVQTQIVGGTKLTPLFHLSGISPGWFDWLGSPHFDVLGRTIGVLDVDGASMPTPEPDVLEQIA